MECQKVDFYWIREQFNTCIVWKWNFKGQLSSFWLIYRASKAWFNSFCWVKFTQCFFDLKHWKFYPFLFRFYTLDELMLGVWVQVKTGGGLSLCGISVCIFMATKVSTWPLWFMRTWSDLKSVEMQGIHLDIYLFFSFSDGHFRVEKIGSLGGKISPTLSSVFCTSYSSVWFFRGVPRCSNDCPFSS